jgi:hypothetical protein
MEVPISGGGRSDADAKPLCPHGISAVSLVSEGRRVDHPLRSTEFQLDIKAGSPVAARGRARRARFTADYFRAAESRCSRGGVHHDRPGQRAARGGGHRPLPRSFLDRDPIGQRWPGPVVRTIG